MQLRSLTLLLASAALLSGCASTPPTPPPPAPPPAEREPALPPQTAVTQFSGLEAWTGAEVTAGFQAFSRSCAQLAGRPGDADLSPRAPWAGRVVDWQPVCESLAPLRDDPAGARRALEALMVPVEVVSQDGASRFTGYFEPMIEARRTPAPPFTAPVPGPPGDIVQTADGPRQQRADGRLVAYPARADITPRNILGYAHPADVFFLQIQGSGRLVFPGGETVRAAYYAHNGRPFRSTANWLLERGKITPGEASMQGIKAWMDRVSPAEALEAMNANPRYVFFQALPEDDPALGPRGAANIPLTPRGSMAVDPRFHAFGVPYLVSTSAPGLGGDWQGILVSQDTGGAILGPVRGDIYFGTGDEAGARAGTMNAPGRMWALLPRSVAARLPEGGSDALAFVPATRAP